MSVKLIKYIMLSVVFIYSFEALAERIVYAAAPVRPHQNSNKSATVHITISNPSELNQTVEVEFSASGDFIFNTEATDGSNLMQCSSNKRCILKSDSRTINAGESKQMGIYVSRTNTNEYAGNNGVSIKIRVLENDGILLASGMSNSEVANSYAYYSSAIIINGGNPF